MCNSSTCPNNLTGIGADFLCHCEKGTGPTLNDYDVWYKPCRRCGYDTAKSRKLEDPRCWKCGDRVYRDYSERALKSTYKKE